MTTAAIIIMTLSVGTITLLFVYCIAKVLSSPRPND